MAADTGFDEKDYWRKRHADMTGRLRAVGIDNLGEHTNARAYQLVAEQYERVLDRLSLSAGTKVVDAGAGVGFFSRLLANRGFDVTAIDISDAALATIECASRKIHSSLAAAPVEPKSAELVHSFDVLYHIMDDREWEASVTAVASWSSRFVVLHERFLHLPQLVPSSIMKMRPVSRTRRLMRDAGFREMYSAPTYAVSKRLLTYKVADYFPDAFYAVDRFLIDAVTNTPLHRLGSHHIKVFERV